MMTRILAIALVTLLATAAGAAQAAAGLLDIPGLTTLVAEKAKESKAAAFVNFEGEVAAGGYLPVWTFHADGQPSEPLAQYLEIGIGGSVKHGENLRPLLTIDANLPALSGCLWSSVWARSHLRRTVLPPLWFGPQVKVPLPGEHFRWDEWRDWLGFIVSVGF